MKQQLLFFGLVTLFGLVSGPLRAETMDIPEEELRAAAHDAESETAAEPNVAAQDTAAQDVAAQDTAAPLPGVRPHDETELPVARPRDETVPASKPKPEAE